MKIRTDFVTNSSSSSFIALGVFDEELADMFQSALAKNGRIIFPNDFLGGISVNDDCVTITTPLNDVDGSTWYRINELDPQENYFGDGGIFISDSKKARTLRNVKRAFEMLDLSANGLDENNVYKAVERAFSKEQVITEVYFDETDGFENKDFSNRDLIPWNLEFNVDGILVKYTERESDGYELICPRCTRGISSSVIRKLKKTKKIKLNEGCKIVAGMFEGVECLEEVDLSAQYWYSDVLPANVFKNCKKLKKVQLPKCLYVIKESAFENCENLTQIELVDNLSYIDESAFKNCASLPTEIKQRISKIIADSPIFDSKVKEAEMYIRTHGNSRFVFRISEYFGYNSLFKERAKYEKWHSLYDEYFDTVERLTRGKLRYVIWSSSGGPCSPSQIEQLGWKQTKEISSATDYLLVDTKDIPNFDRFLQKQKRIDDGDIQGAAIFGNNPLEKAINLKKEGGKIKILPLDLFCKLLEEGDFEEIVVEDRTEEMKARREAEKAAKKENKESQCEELIASIVAKSKESGVLFTNAEIIALIEASSIPATRVETYISNKYGKTVKDHFEALGVLKTVRTDFYSLIALLKQRYENKPKVADFTSLITDSADLDLSIIAYNSKRITGLSTREYLLQEGILAETEAVKSVEELTEGVLYKTGEEPADIKKRIDTLFEKLDGAYPDKVIVGLHTDHKKWGETVTDLYRKLGYKSGADFLTAYGYKISDAKGGGRPKADHTIIIEEIKRRYPNGANFKTADEFIQANTDLSKQLATLRKDAQQVLGMTFGKWLKSIGLMGDNN